MGMMRLWCEDANEGLRGICDEGDGRENVKAGEKGEKREGCGVKEEEEKEGKGIDEGD